MTLNTFRYAGVSSNNETHGVPRLKEIINVYTKIKTPSLSVYPSLTMRSSKSYICSLDSPWLLHLELDRAKMIYRKLTMAYVAGRIAEMFKADQFLIWSEDNSEKLIIHCRVLGGDHRDDDSLRTLEEDSLAPA
jgi:DNA-directed RNA polymerase II subunit RPB1